MGHNKYKERDEQVEIMRKELRAHGIKHWTERMTGHNHVIMSFLDPKGNPKSLTIGGSNYFTARLRNRSILRQILGGSR